MKNSFLGERWTLRLIVITPLAALAILTVVILSFYVDKMNFYFYENSQRYLDEYISGEKRQGEIFIRDVNLLARFAYNHLNNKTREALDERLELAYNAADNIYNKYHGKLPDSEIKERIIDAISGLTWYGEKNYVFVTDYEGNSIHSASPDLIGKNISGWSDADGRAIILEEIQMARKEGEGYLVTRFRAETGEQTIKVKDFGRYDWFFGSGIHRDRILQEEKERILKLIALAPKDASGYTAIFENKSLLFVSEESGEDISAAMIRTIEEQLVDKNGWVDLPHENAHMYIRYFKPFNWHLVYGFKKSYFDSRVREQQQKIKARFDEEVRFVIAATTFVAILVGILTFIVSRRIIAIIQDYKEVLEVREAELRVLNFSLEERVNEEVADRRAKEKMLIQQSKMADMGDMISMIAHQWRQPLNQMSYVLMNIDSAYEFNELTPKYMDEKVQEGTKLLEYMSHTIDDFRNFFKPDRERSKEQISELIKHTKALVEKSLEEHNIAVRIDVGSDATLTVYRNELLQVILNLITNAKDALVMNGIADPEISIVVTEDEESIRLEVCDNGGGVDEAIQEKIFEPYFSTKGEQRGTGLGLYMAKTIVEEHLNGELLVVNRQAGACFTVVLRKR